MISTCPKCDKPVSIPAGVDASAAVRCPLCNAEYALGEALTPPPPELIPVVLPDVQLPGAITGETAAEPHEEREPQPDPEGENEAVAVAEAFTAKPVVARRRRKPKSALQTLIEVVAGGVAGCLVAYYGLAFWYGPEFSNKMPVLPLPGIEQIIAPPPAPGHSKAKTAEKKSDKSQPDAGNRRG